MATRTSRGAPPSGRPRDPGGRARRRRHPGAALERGAPRGAPAVRGDGPAAAGRPSRRAPPGTHRAPAVARRALSPDPAGHGLAGTRGGPRPPPRDLPAGDGGAGLPRAGADRAAQTPPRPGLPPQNGAPAPRPQPPP